MSTKIYSKGSEWRKWDLHVHTSASDCYQNSAVTNEEIIEGFKKNNISIAAITDHHFIDVKNIKALQALGEKEGITILPGIELRSELGGSESVHYIGIFPEDCNLDEIWTDIQSKCNLKPSQIASIGKDKISIDLNDTCKLIHELGGITTVHAGGKSNSIESIKNNQEFKQFLKKKIAKESIDILELGSKDDEDDANNVIFPNIGFRLPMIICSDNHNILKYELKENCWIKADPTFEGLKQIIYEPEDRVFIGKTPAVIERVKNNKTKYIRSLKINNIKGKKAKKGEWFKDVNMDFNSELVAIIGNKGSGKSAISDVLGVLGDTHNAKEKHKNLSFLNNDNNKKFRKKGFAENFEAELTWEDLSTIKAPLDKDIDTTKNEKVKYLPQNYFESLTNSLEEEDFEETLKSVIFLHIPKTDKYGKNTFKELEDYKSTSIQKDLPLLESAIDKISIDIINLEKRKHPNYRKRIEHLLEKKEKELSEHEKIKPEEIKNPDINKDPEIVKKKEEQSTKITELNSKLEKVCIEIKNKNFEKSKLALEKEDLQQIADDLERFQIQIDDYKELNKIRFEKYGFDIAKLIKSKFDNEIIKNKISEKTIALEKIEGVLLSSQEIENRFKNNPHKIIELKKDGLKCQQTMLEQELTILRKELSQPDRLYQEYLDNLKKWEDVKKEIEGDKENPTDTPDTVEFYKHEMNFIDNKLPTLLSEKRKSRINKSLEIFAKKKEFLGLYEEFKESIDKEIKKDKEFRKKFKMDINVSFKISSKFVSNFLDFINKVKRGTFFGKVEGEKHLSKILDEKNLTNENDVKSILITIIEYLEIDHRPEVKKDDKSREISDQIDQIENFYKFIFSLSYLEPNYELRLDDKVLGELSPGEKGALLLVFYLMIDKEDTPLIIDQPEDNLDNKSVFEVLTHFIRFAKNRRQIIIVTHNPNLAIGADAEQIIHVNIDKKNNYKFSYLTGAIENPMINRKVVEILEGTRPAFDKRKLKYLKED